MDQPSVARISVIIPAYNEEASLRAAIQALTEHQSHPAFEIIVVDNASTDRTRELALEAGVRVVDEPKRGVVHARQAGFLAATGDILATTDADTVVPSDWLQAIHEQFQSDPTLVALGGPVSYDFDERWLRELFDRAIPLLQEVDRLLYKGHFVSASFAVRREPFHQIGGFRTSLQSSEDIDLAHRLARLGPVRLSPKLRVVTSGRRFRREGPQAIWRYFQSYLRTLQPAEPVRAQLRALVDDYKQKIGSRSRR